jgi:hypothetical protein
MQQPVQPDFVLPSGLLTQNRSSKKEINYPSWTFWKLEFFGGYIKVLQCAIFCKLKSLPYTPQQTKKIARKNLQKKVTE